ncbi:hypothetical protein [uncultured Tateyamaria sp.]|uniref:hypothetical protein n=1 Tax=uncultured Tateyamaria sp. TaxID=455651 RepID=UPI0026276EEE|nr:hypothetical protein [uncultured Tateyamaria sp.]
MLLHALPCLFLLPPDVTGMPAVLGAFFRPFVLRGVPRDATISAHRPAFMASVGLRELR